MGITIKTDLDSEKAIFSESGLRKGLGFATNQLGMELNDYDHSPVPMQHGDLRDTATPDVESDRVNFSSPYAAPQFRGGYTLDDGTKVTFHQYTTPGTGPDWDKAIQANSEQMARIRNAYLKGMSL